MNTSPQPSPQIPAACSGETPAQEDVATDQIFGSELLKRMQISFQKLASELREQRNVDGHWTGELSVSALSTATAISALAVAYKAVTQPTLSDVSTTQRSSNSWATVEQVSHWKTLIQQGSRWLAQAQNDDGGFGDTNRSVSNIATTLLVLAAWKLAEVEDVYSEQIAQAQQYVQKEGHWDGLRRRYGKDKTFVVPIMTNCALAAQVEWSKIPTLPFEAVALPQSWYRFAKMPVVSYAVPALVAIGQAQLHHNPPLNPISRAIRKSVRGRTLKVLRTMQPESGGYLEATPLTSFVLMNLASIGLVHHPVCRDAIRFIVDSVTADGSWPIDTNLATWVTSLTTRSYFPVLVAVGADGGKAEQDWKKTIEWILSCQHLRRHPFTGAEPGGWGWTNLSGSVPDSDDTPAALLVLARYYQRSDNEQSTALLERIRRAADAGCEWLLKLQNSDGGWPTFCRGWGTLPFDRSGADLTAHAIRALHAWKPSLQPHQIPLIDRAIERGWRYLTKHQCSDGSWQPLWFGNQDRSEEDNPYYGTARVLMAYAETGRASDVQAEQAIAFLKQNQNVDGSWGADHQFVTRITEQANSLIPRKNRQERSKKPLLY